MQKKNWIYIGVGILLILAVWFVYPLITPLFVDVSVDEPIPDDMQGMTEEEMQEMMENALMMGEFGDADDFHKTSGEALVIEDSNLRYLRFENFETTNGPDLYVYLATDNSAEDFVDLGRLKGNIGNQNYEIPDDVDLSEYDKVLIWCKAFGVLFGSAELN